MKVLKLTNLLFLLVALIPSGVMAQDSPDGEEPRDVVMYDPLFWKDELSLRNNQSRRIEEINTEFYESIRQNRSDDQEKNSSALERGLQQRSQKIFDTLLPKQRRKLEKIIDKTAPVTAP